MVDDALARSFESIGADYERYRPGFPTDVVDLIAPERLSAILDLGAGTGKLTELLLDSADRVVAVEPSSAMLDVLRAKLPGVIAAEGTAESIPVVDASFDAVTVAQAFHWFHRDPACAEIARVLKPGGLLALIWNRADTACKWDRSCHRIVHPAVGSSDSTTSSASAELPGFVSIGHEEIHWAETISRVDYVRRWTTVSSFLVATEAEREEMLASVEHTLDGDADTRGRIEFELPHITDVYLYRRA